jgi:4-hydroxy-tetrahydrodipicolinate reductase
MVNILHIGLGPLGAMIATDIFSRGVGRLVAAVDIDPAIAGRKLSDVIPGGSPEVIVRPTIEAAMNDARAAGGVDVAVVATSSDLAKCMGTFRDLITRGLSIVSTCEELLYPWLRHPKAADELAQLTEKHGARIVGTGVNPGCVMDTFAVATTAVCRSVRAVRVWRIQDATTRRIPFQQKIGAGVDDAEFKRRVDAGVLRHVGLGESLHFIAKYVGLPIDRWEETIEPVRAERDLTCALGPIKRGGISGVQQRARGWSAGTCVVELDFRAAIGQDNPHDRVLIEGEPPLDVTIKGGIHGDVATSAITVNAIWPTLRALPGLHTMATLPMVRHISRAEGNA